MTPDPNGTGARKAREPHIDEFEAAWGNGRPKIEDFLPRVGEHERAYFLEDLLVNELEIRRARGELPAAEEYLARFPDASDTVRKVFARPGTSNRTTTLLPVATPTRSSNRFQPGTRIAERFVIVDHVGAGGMGEVYRANDSELHEPVALKFLPESAGRDPARVAALREEVAKARKVSHENVCRVYDLAVHDGMPILVMEFVNDGSLVSEIARRPNKRLEPTEVNVYARQLCEGLAAVHRSGYLHRDLKPANVLISDNTRDRKRSTASGPERSVKLADFGLATSGADLTADQIGAGTVLYMAPEQLGGREVTEQSDLFALGLVLYELLTGQRPFPGMTREELARQHAQLIPARPSTLVAKVDPALEQVILRCLEHDPKNRPGSALEVEAALPPPTPKEVEDKQPSKPLRPRVAVALFGAVLLGLSLLAAVADRTMAYRQLPEVQTREVLSHRAREILATLTGSRESPGQSGYEWDVDLLKEVATKRPDGWHPTPDARAPLVYFWYRSDPFAPTPMNRITPADPPMTAKGTACVVLDPEGNLIEYYAVPAREPPAAPAGERDAQRERCEHKLFEVARLNRAEFTRVPARKRPTTFADDVWALDEKGGAARRVEFASCDGSTVYFCVSSGRPESKDRVEGENIVWARDRKLVSDVPVLIVLFSALVALPLAYKNWNLGRADMTGAVRVVALYVGTALASWALITQHTMALHTERVLLMHTLGVVAFWGGLILVFYLAVEPYLRRTWPERLSSWNRALRGKLLDPLVGRDVLVGVLAGACVVLPLRLSAALQDTFYLPTLAYEPFTPNVPSGLLIGLAAFAILRAAGMFVLLLLFGLLVRREWIAGALVTAVLAYGARLNLPTMPTDTTLTWLGAIAFMGSMVCVAIRFGWLALLTCSFVGSVLNVMPLTFAPHAWYATNNAATFAALLGLALFGFFVSLGGQRLLPDEW